MITIEQLLESVELDFEPRWVAKDKGGLICVYTEKPECGICSWFDGGDYMHIGYLKLSEFDSKDWTECIYEVSRKTTKGIILKLKSDGGSHPDHYDFMKKINEIIDWVNDNYNAREICENVLNRIKRGEE